MTKQNKEVVEAALRERPRLRSFILGRVREVAEADDILQDVFQEFVEACRLPSPIEQASAWLYRVARNRIIDRYRKKRELPLDVPGSNPDDTEGEYRLDLMMPSPDAGPEAEYARHLLLKQLQQALSDLPENQREVFVAHELEGISFKEMAAQSGIPINTLLARKRYAVLYLRTRLQAVYDELDT